MIYESAIQVAGNWMLCEYESFKTGAIRVVSLGSVEACDLPTDAKRARAARRSIEEAGQLFFDAIPPGRKLVILHQDPSSSPQRWRRTQLLKRDVRACPHEALDRGVTHA